MEENKQAIQRYLNRSTSNSNLYTITKIKPSNISIKDGIITYGINLNSLVCQCSSKNNSTNLCNHKIFVLTTYFKLDWLVIIFIHKLIKHFQENKHNNNLNEILLNVVNNEILSDECGICMENIGGSKSEISECDTCKKYCHSKCVKRWLNINKKQDEIKKCVYCNTGNIILT